LNFRRGILDADPTTDIANTTRIHAVWHRGKQVYKAAK
jgi:imidazolonepropionase-like amidohydrolase